VTEFIQEKRFNWTLNRDQSSNIDQQKNLDQPK